MSGNLQRGSILYYYQHLTMVRLGILLPSWLLPGQGMKITFTNISHSSYVSNIQTSNMSICTCNQDGKRTPEPEDAALYPEAKKT